MPPDAIRNAITQALQGNPERALASLRALVQRHPSDPDANHYLGLLLLNHGPIDQALYYLQRSVDLGPAQAPLLANLGLALTTAGRFIQAAETYRRALAIDPNHLQSHLGLVRALVESLDFESALAAAARAVQTAPHSPRTHIALSIARMQSGRADLAAAVLREALARLPGNHELLTALVATLNYRHDVAPREITGLSRQLGATLAAAAGPQAPLPTRNSPARLRIGYLSPDLRDHAIASFMEGPLAHHDRAAFDIFCYGPSPTHDAVSKRLRSHAKHWIDVSRMPDSALVSRIRADGIDILVELSGHTAGTRLHALARRAAPIHVSYLGYPATTGMPTIDARIVDSLTDPPGEPADSLSTERLIRLDPCFLCYSPPRDAPDPSPPPHTTTGHVTFGSLNAVPKLSEAALDTWAGILAAVPNSRLILKARPLGSPTTQANILKPFTTRGIDPSRINFRGHSDSASAHLSTYHQIDIALDPFPYTGTTTTCEALHMGVPVVTLAGGAHAGRVGVSLLTQVGLQDLIADSPDAYTRTAAAIAADTVRLAALRTSLRPTLAASPLCNPQAFTRRLEAAYRALHQATSHRPPPAT